jgi:4'-phosphopantetheinyl transferase
MMAAAAWTPARLSEWTTPLIARRGVLDIWSIPLELPDAKVLRCETLLACDERERAQRFIRPLDQRRYIVAHAALRILLAKYCGTSVSGVRYATGTHGKPALIGQDASGITFNMSHSGELALVGVAMESCVGVDVEELRAVDDARSIARSFFAPGEIAALASAPPADTDAAFLRCWTRKEAFVKAIGGGLSIGLDSFEVDISRAQPALRHIGGDTASAENWTIVHLEPKPRYIAAAAVQGAVDEVICRTVDPVWCGASNDNTGLALWPEVQ